MAWIKSIGIEEADGELAAIYASLRTGRGGVAAVHQAQSLNVAALRAHIDLYKAVVFQRSSLSRIARERIAVVVSAVNDCSYCIAHHAEALRQLRDEPAVVDALARGEVPENLAEPDRALLVWARSGANQPAATKASDLESLRACGYDERALLDAALTVAYFAFVNRLVLLLGVHIEPDYRATCGDGG